MKEWILKHPIMTFLLADTAIAAVANIFKFTVAAFAPNRVIEVEAMPDDLDGVEVVSKEEPGEETEE